MFELASQMQPKSFLKEVKAGEHSLLHQCVIDDNVEAFLQLSRLSYIHEIIDDQDNA